MRKQRIVLLVLSTVFINCNTNKLEGELEILKKENKELRDSINKLNYAKILSSEMIILPSKEKVGGQKFDGLLCNRLNEFSFDLYQLDTLHYTKGVKKREIFTNHSSPQFQIEVDRSLIKNKTLYLLAEYDLDSIKIQVPGILYLN
ncbi:conserved protein of unknown function [Tenacibaculum sp. 190130A14a]|uniref:Lipoprotein n=1 Tax=Tenacibaculum polynesiense TaxID=3137857 RepID=A0ABM9P924_9FLAO